MVIYTPRLSKIFKTFPLEANDWMIAIGFSFIEMLVSSFTTNPKGIVRLDSYLIKA